VKNEEILFNNNIQMFEANQEKENKGIDWINSTSTTTFLLQRFLESR
jgi:hypothetical protein